MFWFEKPEIRPNSRNINNWQSRFGSRERQIQGSLCKKILPQSVFAEGVWERIFCTLELLETKWHLVEIISDLGATLSNLIFPKRDIVFRKCLWGETNCCTIVFLRVLRIFFCVSLFRFSYLQFPPCRIAGKLWGIGTGNCCYTLLITARSVGV